MKINGSQIFVEVLVEQGVDTIFGYPGGAVLDIYDALYKNSDRVRHILTAHEQGAAHAADGYARATGKTGVCLATSGPGATNLVTGIATAYMDSIPMVAITGNVGTKLIGKDSFQEVYIAGITMPITKHNFTVRRVEELADVLRDAFRIAQTGRPGPVLVDIPKDVMVAECEFENKAPLDTSVHFEVQDSDFQRIAAAINAAERPVVYFGGGVATADAGKQLSELLHKANIPAVSTIMAIGVLSADDPFNLGMIGMHGKVSCGFAVDKADLVIALGARFSDRVATDPNAFAPNAKIIHADIDAAEINKNMATDDSIVADAKTFLEGVLPYVEAREHKEWLAQIDDWKKRMDYRAKDDASVLKPHQVIGTIADLAGDDCDHRYRRRPAPDVGSPVQPPQPHPAVHHFGWSGHHGLWLWRRHRRADRLPGQTRCTYHGRWLVPHEFAGDVHHSFLRPACHHGRYEQPGARHGSPVADHVLRQAVFGYRPAPQDRFCQARRSLWRSGHALHQSGRIPAGICQGTDQPGPDFDRLRGRLRRARPAHDPGRQVGPQHRH